MVGAAFCMGTETEIFRDLSEERSCRDAAGEARKPDCRMQCQKRIMKKQVSVQYRCFFERFLYGYFAENRSLTGKRTAGSPDCRFEG